MAVGGVMDNRDPAADCVFCAIASGEDTSVEIVTADEGWVAFFPLEPATRGHTLVIPKQHFEDLWDTPAHIAAELTAAAVAVGRAIRRALEPDGMNLITSSGAAAEQTVFHIHLHVVPRWSGDAIGPIWPDTAPKWSDLPSVARQIRAAL